MDACAWIGLRFELLGPLTEDGRVSLVADRLKDGRLGILKRARRPDEVAALEREGRRLDELRHPGLRGPLAHGRAEGEALLVLEHVAGASLAEHLAAEPDDATVCAVELLRVLVYLHERGRIHGDLKPANVIVDEARRAPRLIDLGLAARAGTPPRGGTRPFLPPEYERGGALSPAGDLYSLGQSLALAAGVGRGRWPRDLADLVEACCAPEPKARPGSAALALARLGRHPKLADRLGGLAPIGVDAVDRAGAEAFGAFDGSCLVVRGARGSGRTRFAETLARAAWRAGRAVADGSLGSAHDPVLALGRLLLAGAPAEGRPFGDVVAETLARASREETVVVLDDADRISEDLRHALEGGVRALSALGSGFLAVVGADHDLAERLVPAGARVLDLPLLGEEDVRSALVAAGARADEAAVLAIHRGSRGRAGSAARAVAELADQPEMGAEEVEEHARAWARDAPPEEEPEESPAEAVAAAGRDLEGRAGRRAAHRLLRAMPWLEERPDDAPDAALLLAAARAAAGDVAAAAELIGRLGPGAPAEARLDRARHLERLGRLEEAAREASALLDAPSVAARAAAVAGMAALAMGQADLAEERVARGLALGCDDRTCAHLLLIRSDVALRRGEPEAAFDLARRAREALAPPVDPRLAAEVHARMASALALSGKALAARDHHRQALEAAEAAGDVAGLAPYLVNMATAEHAAGELASAIVRYERAAGLADRLGRTAIRAAALTNLAGLYAAASATDEASRVLADAEVAARASRSALMEAQTVLIRAEVEAARDPARGRALAEEARDRFLACGAERQRLEAELLRAELGEGKAAREEARAFCVRKAAELDEAGLGPRARLLRARHALEAERLDEARMAAEDARAGAASQGDRDAEARADLLLAEVHRRLDTGGEEAHLARARETFAALAARLPEGLRARFLASPSRAAAAAPRRAADPSRAPAEGLGPGGRRIVELVTRVLLEEDESALLEAAVDQAVAATRAERAFLLRRRTDRPRGEAVIVARNLDGESLRRGRRSSFSRSVADQVISSGRPVVTAMASEDPRLKGARSILDLGVRSILCVPVRGPRGVVGALYLDHRFHEGRFGEADLELVQAMAHVMGVALENARLHQEARQRTEQLERANEAVSRENARRAAEVAMLEDRLARSGGEVEPEGEGGIVGRAPALRAAIAVARRVAPSDLPVLVTGESGTGKELVARFIHDQSLRSAGPFLAVNCGSIPELLLESELFGHTRGAFTGADRDSPGLFRAARGGTVLLDEIGEMPLRMQTRILRTLQEREVVPVGATAPVRLDVRVIAATNRDLTEEVEAGRFRKDLYFRLVGVTIALPPLRERVEDVPLLARHALEAIAAEPGMRRLELSREALAALAGHDWPGNVRELVQALRRAVLVAEGEAIRPEDLGLTAPGLPRREALRRYDEQLVTAALKAAGGNRTVAARALGVSRMTIHRWIKRHGLDG